MTLQLTKALAGFNLAEEVELDCGIFDVVIRQAAVHNEAFRAAITQKTIEGKKRSLTAQKGSITGTYEQDVELFIDHVLISWGKRPLVDDNGNTVPFVPANLRELFTGSRAGRVLFAKIQAAAVDDQMFAVTDADLGN